MSFTERIKRIWVEDEVKDVPEGTTASDILNKSGQSPKKRTLVKSNPDGTTTLYRNSEKPVLKDGDVFETQINVRGG